MLFALGFLSAVGLGYYDVRHLKLPYVFLGLFTMVGMIYSPMPLSFQDLLYSPDLILGILGFCIRFGGRHIYQKEVLGQGDIWLLTAIGMWLDFEDLSLFFMICGGLIPLTKSLLRTGPRVPFAIPSLTALYIILSWKALAGTVI